MCAVWPNDGSLPEREREYKFQRTRDAHDRAIRVSREKPRREIADVPPQRLLAGAVERQAPPPPPGCPRADREQPCPIAQGFARRRIQEIERRRLQRAGEQAVARGDRLCHRVERQQKTALRLRRRCQLEIYDRDCRQRAERAVMSFAISSPATLFTTRPPDCASVPSIVANCIR